VISLLFFDDKIDLTKFSLSGIMTYCNELIFNHELLCLIIEKGFMDIIFSTNEGVNVFSGEILSFLLQNFRSYEMMHSIQIYFCQLIHSKDQKKISVINKQRQNLIKELFDVFCEENINPYIIIKITKVFNSLIYLENDQLKTITALINKNIVDVILNKLNSNNLNLILSLTTLLKSLTNKIEASNIKSSFTKNIDNLIKNVTKLIQLNKYFHNRVLVDKLITIHINFVAKGNDNQKFYLIDIKNSEDKQKSLVGTLINVFFDNVISEENFVMNKNKLDELSEKFRADIKILSFFQCLIKNYKPMKNAFKDKMELDFFCYGKNESDLKKTDQKLSSDNLNNEVNINNRNKKNPSVILISGYNQNENRINTSNNINYVSNKKVENVPHSKFNDKINKISSIIKNKIIIQSSENNAFFTLINKFSFEFIVDFYRFVSNIVEFCFYLLNEDDIDNIKKDNNNSYINCLKDLSSNIGDLIKSVPHANNSVANQNPTSKVSLDRLVQAHEALNRLIEGQADI